ncbi:hypothetical protein D3C84_912390 [compost metagenome]
MLSENGRGRPTELLMAEAVPAWAIGGVAVAEADLWERREQDETTPGIGRGRFIRLPCHVACLF